MLPVFVSFILRCITLSKGSKYFFPFLQVENSDTCTVELLNWEENQGLHQVYCISSNFNKHTHVPMVK